MKAPPVWSERVDDAFRSLCATRWGFFYREDDGFTLRDVVEHAYLGSDALTLDDFAERLAARSDSDPEVQAFIGRMVVGETSFFRNRAQFDALETTVLPELIAERRKKGDLRLRMWSAGCSSGEEPYSLAILLAMLVPDWERWDVRIVATDLNPFALRRAAAALYSDWSFRETDPLLVARFFTRTARLYRLDHPCRELVTFRRHNLAIDPMPDPRIDLADLDLILCRNVTIYFDRDLTTRLSGAFYEALRPGGWLVVGHTEPDTSYYARFQHREFPDAIFYRRPPVGESARASSVVAQTTDVTSPIGASRTAARPIGSRVSIDDAMAAYEARDLAGAFALLHDVAERAPRDPLPYHMLAQVSADEKRYDEALYWAFVALQCDAFHVPTLLLLGLVFLERGDAERAKEHFNQAIYLEPMSTAAHLYLSMAHRALGRDELAARSSRRAARLAGEDSTLARPRLPVERAHYAIPRDERR